MSEYDVRRRKDQRRSLEVKGGEGLRRWLVMIGGKIGLTFEKGVGGKCLRRTESSCSSNSGARDAKVIGSIP